MKQLFTLLLSIFLSSQTLTALSFDEKLSVHDITKFSSERLEMVFLDEYDHRASLQRLLESCLEDDYLIYYFTYPRRWDLESIDSFIDVSVKENSQTLLAWLNKTELSDINYVIQDINTHELIGCLGIHGCPNNQVSLSILIGKAYAGKKYGTESIKSALEFIKEKCPTTDSIEWVCVSRNEASIKVAEKCGFDINAKTQKLCFGRILYFFERSVR